MRFLIFLLVVGAVLLLLFNQFPSAISSSEDKTGLIYSSLLLVMVAGGTLFSERIKLSEGLKYAAIWIGILLVCMIGYSYRDLLLDSRVGAELMPSRPHVLADGALQFRTGEHGHFFADGEVNGVRVRFLIDTGASDIVLSPRDAERAGYGLDGLTFDRAYSTANGTGGGARIVLDSLRVGSYELTKVKASVNKAEMDESILGMTFLGQFRSYRVEGNTLTLTP